VARERERSWVSLGGHEQRLIPLSGAALAVARGTAPLLATSGECVALAAFAQAITVSADDGRAFRRVPGTANTTALSGARVGDAARFFAAVYRETTDQSEILLVDPVLGEALCIAFLDGGDESSAPDPVDRGEWARVTRLIWHPATGHLWAVGGFGVLSFAPPELP
jgi:hypothetical protein